MIPVHTEDRQWWKEAVVYQSCPHSGNDTTGFGSGDLLGTTEKLNCFVDLGGDVVWLAPGCDSTMNEVGYDIRADRSTADLSGTMANFDEILGGVYERGLRLVMDLDRNHTSSEREWFRRSRRSRDRLRRADYHWPPPVGDGGRQPTGDPSSSARPVPSTRGPARTTCTCPRTLSRTSPGPIRRSVRTCTS